MLSVNSFSWMLVQITFGECISASALALSCVGRGKPGPSDSEMSELLEHELRLVKIVNKLPNAADDASMKGIIQTNRAAWKHAQEVHDQHQKSVVQIVHGVYDLV